MTIREFNIVLEAYELLRFKTASLINILPMAGISSFKL